MVETQKELTHGTLLEHLMIRRSSRMPDASLA